MKNKFKDYILIVAVSAFMFVVIVWTIIKPDIGMSENENRYLEQRPEISVETLVSGRFEEAYENYITDQIIGRESAIKAYTMLLRFLGFNDINGVYFTDNNKLAQRTEKTNFNTLVFNRNLEEVKQFTDELDEWYIDTTTMLIHSAAYTYAKQPDNSVDLLSMYDEDLAFNKAVAVIGDSFIPFLGNTDDFFNTDHHWNDKGAFEAFCEFNNEVLHNTVETYDKIPHEILTDSFKGTLYSKVLIDTIDSDTITVPSASLNKNVTVSIDGKEYDSVYFMDRLENKDKYEVYFGGNYDRVDIEISGNEDKPKLMIIKDSYANSFVPYLLDYYSEITMIDTRYFKDSVIDTAIDEDFDSVLVLYSITNFAEAPISLITSTVE